jgi:predicted restriction endonuclease
MLTSGVEFINAKGFLRYPIKAFSTIDDVIAARDSNRRSNTSNNSTYLTYADNNTAQIYAKTYGASKKEAILVCQAAARLSRYVELFEIREQNMRELPSPDKAAIEKLGNVTVIQTNREMERIALKQDANFRSPTFIYNLFQKYQIKECAFCDCQIPQIIAGAHIWPVADIKRDLSLSEDEQLHCAVDGDNGLWLCYNHHKMFDENIIKITDDGRIVWDNSKSNAFRVFIRKATPKRYILHDCWSERFEYYLQKRNAMLSS